MTEQQKAAMQQALEALEYGQHSLKQISEHQWESRGHLAMVALRAALAEPEQRPISAVTEAVTKTVIEIEKMLCEKLGRRWQPSGMSIQTLVDELASPPARRSEPEPEPEPEPVAWKYKSDKWFDGESWRYEIKVTMKERVAKFHDDNPQPLYTTPPARRPLTPVQEAAPELLEALHAMLSHTAMLDPSQGFDGFDHAAVNQARAAIAKAGGNDE